MDADQLRYHATEAWIHLSTIADLNSGVFLTDVSRDVLLKAILLMHVLSGGEDVREARYKTNTEIIDN